MATVAIIGADGAGKTTVAKQLDRNASVPIKYIYMGANIESSNVALPTSRLMLYLKLRSYKKKAKRTGITDSSYVSTHHEAHRNIKYGKVTSTIRMFNRLAEACYRQFVSWIYQVRGFIVVYDRHFLFEAATGDTKSSQLADRIYYWILAYLYPQPDLVIFLDAPPEVLLARKGEGTPEYLAKRRQTYLSQGEKMSNFICVNASRPFDQVYTDVNQHITKFHTARGKNTL